MAPKRRKTSIVPSYRRKSKRQSGRRAAARPSTQVKCGGADDESRDGTITESLPVAETFQQENSNAKAVVSTTNVETVKREKNTEAQAVVSTSNVETVKGKKY